MNNYDTVSIDNLQIGMLIMRHNKSPSFNGGLKVFNFLTSNDYFKIVDIRNTKVCRYSYHISSPIHSYKTEIKLEGLDFWFPVLAFCYNRKLRLKNYLDFID